MAAATATQEAFWLRDGTQCCYSNCTSEDKKGYISLADHPGNHRNSKHIDCIHHFVREGVQRGDIAIQHVTTVLFLKFRDKLVVSRATLNIVEKLEKSKQSTATEASEEPDKRY